MLSVQDTNHPMALIRPSSETEVLCTPSLVSRFVVFGPTRRRRRTSLHYLRDGNVTFRFSWRKNEYLVAVVMVLRPWWKLMIARFSTGLSLPTHQLVLTDRLELLLRTYKQYNLHSRKSTLAYLGDKFRVAFGATLMFPDIDVGREVLKKKCACPFTYKCRQIPVFCCSPDPQVALVASDCYLDNPDATQHQEVLLGGFLWNDHQGEIERYLQNIKMQISLGHWSSWGPCPTSTIESTCLVCLCVRAEHWPEVTVTSCPPVIWFHSRVLICSRFPVTRLWLKINFYRFISLPHWFTEGSFFAELKTTTVRKLLPESWGFCVLSIHPMDRPVVC